MAKTDLEKAIAQASESFALKVVEAVKGATLQELIALQGDGAPQKPGPKPRKKPGPKPRKKPGPKPRKKPGPKPKSALEKVVKKAAAKKKRVVKNYPKCAFPRCNKNRFVRGKGFCGDHWRKWKAGKIKAASTYKKKK